MARRLPPIESHADALARFPDLSLLAAEIRRPYHTVYAWTRRNNIPPGYWLQIEAASKALGVRGITERLLRDIAKAADQERVQRLDQREAPEESAPARRPDKSALAVGE